MSNLNYARLAGLVFGTPLLIEQGKLDVILGVLSPRMGFDLSAPPPPTDEETIAAHQRQRAEAVEHAAMAIGQPVQRSPAGYSVVAGTAVIPVMGSLVQRGSTMNALSGLQSYQETQAMVAAAMEDPSVSSLLFEVDSGGGAAAGVFDLADYIYSQRGKKPMAAHANETAASAAYLIASSADSVAVTRTARVGSVGVVMAHIDRSKALDKAGTAVTYIYAGDKKVDGNPTMPLPDSVRADMQSGVDEAYNLFVNTVARNRGMTAEAVRATQAGMFTGSAAVDMGFADRVGTLSGELSTSISSRTGARLPHQSTQSQETPMTDATQEAAHAAALTEAKAASLAEGAAAERSRVSAILTHAEASGRDALARHLALETDTPAEQAAALLAAAPKTASQDEDTPLGRAMSRNGSPGLRNEAPELPASLRADGKGEALWDSAIAHQTSKVNKAK